MKSLKETAKEALTESTWNTLEDIQGKEGLFYKASLKGKTNYMTTLEHIHGGVTGHGKTLELAKKDIKKNIENLISAYQEILKKI
jgi:predicted RNase H-like HicB family nuclease